MASSDKGHTVHRASAHIGRDHYRTEIDVEGHKLIADEPPGINGTDLGPRPVAMMLGALGACTGITLRMYADRKEWPMEGVQVELEHERVRLDEYEGGDVPADAKGMIDVIRMNVTIEGDELTPEQVERIGVIAGKCPVHRIIGGTPVFNTVLKHG